MSWVTQLTSNLREEFGDKPRIVTLATVSRNRANARCVVARELTERGDILFTSDARSDKNAELRANPLATAVVWLPTMRRQYRVEGTTEILEPQNVLRVKLWRETSSASRAMFFWPTPGGTFDPEIIPPPPIETDIPIPPSFEILVLRPERVETLDLNTLPHTRLRWSRIAGQWSSKRINA